MPKQVAIWNSARDVWETPQTEGLFCEHLDVYSETFPTSGSMRNGVAYALPTWEPAIHDSGSSSLLMTPVASEGIKPSNTMGIARRMTTGQVFLTNQIVTICGLDPSEQLLPTPVAQHSGNTPENHLRKKPGREIVTDLQIIVEYDLLRTGGRTNPQSVIGKQSWEDVPLPLPNPQGAIKDIA